MPLSIHDILNRHWGYSSFRPMQEEIIASVLSGHDTLGLLPTGGGKSITFQVPALALDGLTIVVTPLISLMKDQVDNLRASASTVAGLEKRNCSTSHRKSFSRKLLSNSCATCLYAL